MNKRTVIIGATPNPSRYAFLAATMLQEEGIEFIPVGIKSGSVLGVPIAPIYEKPPIEQVDTITLYIGPQHQPEHEQYILSLKPKRVIFNPGTENPEFEQKLKGAGIETLEACTLVLLRTGQY